MDGSSQCLPSTATGGWRQPVSNIHCQAVNSFFIDLQINFGLSTFKKIYSWTMLQGDIEKSQKYSKDGSWLPPYFVSVNLGEQALNTRGTKVSCRSQLYWEHQVICTRELRRVTWVKRTITTTSCIVTKNQFFHRCSWRKTAVPSFLSALPGRSMRTHCKNTSVLLKDWGHRTLVLFLGPFSQVPRNRTLLHSWIMFRQDPYSRVLIIHEVLIWLTVTPWHRCSSAHMMLIKHLGKNQQQEL